MWPARNGQFLSNVSQCFRGSISATCGQLRSWPGSRGVTFLDTWRAMFRQRSGNHVLCHADIKTEVGRASWVVHVDRRSSWSSSTSSLLLSSVDRGSSTVARLSCSSVVGRPWPPSSLSFDRRSAVVVIPERPTQTFRLQSFVLCCSGTGGAPKQPCVLDLSEGKRVAMSLHPLSALTPKRGSSFAALVLNLIGFDQISLELDQTPAMSLEVS